MRWVSLRPRPGRPLPPQPGGLDLPRDQVAEDVDGVPDPLLIDHDSDLLPSGDVLQPELASATPEKQTFGGPRCLISAILGGADVSSADPALHQRVGVPGEEGPPGGGAVCSRLPRWVLWSPSDARAMRVSSLITTLNPMAETASPARLIQSFALIVTGSSARIIEKGRATFTLFPCETSAWTGRDLRARAVPLPSAIPGPPVSQADSAARTTPRAVRAAAGSSVSGVVRQRYLRRQP